ncbi:Similar to akr1a1a: Aldo-keto reductase family 1 member A1-A (Danio rerio) [Cotesia congregata]|uniref:Similar to akr1a1a: Aldo-keto reductase family 1 member A1-A (Danio rerio) n=1 Tax=Cotesia congregata TaxID=51543 RepID=A0A8J2HQ44_COTCN|nr:Similar to akr1a1a: Aldo-keto reductase family 1 member A1-A (Danio rerio) [Cotesia congregata]
MASKVTITLPNGQKMPALGFGTWQAKDEAVLTKALESALEAGYRHIDTAPVYENEHVIGKVLNKWIQSGKVKREELFIVTKLPPTGSRPGGVEKWIKKSLNDLQLNYLDLYLIHTPFTFEEIGDDLHPKDESGKIKIDKSTDHIAVWKEMENQVSAGRTKAIGLSNFNIKQIEKVISVAKEPIANLQIELHAYFQQNEMVNFCKKKGITVTAYSPLGTRGFVNLIGKNDKIPSIMDNSELIKIGKKYNKSSAQIALKFIIQKGIAAIPKSTNPKRIQENIDLFDFELDSNDIKIVNSLDQGPSARICDFDFFAGIREHPEYPF